MPTSAGSRRSTACSASTTTSCSLLRCSSPTATCRVRRPSVACGSLRGTSGASASTRSRSARAPTAKSRTLYHRVQQLSLAFYEQRRTGDMVVRLTSDIDAAESFITSGVLTILLDLVTLAGMLCVMFYLDPHFSLIALSTAPLLFLLIH